MFTKHLATGPSARRAHATAKKATFKAHHDQGAHHVISNPNSKTIKTGAKRPSIRMIENMRRNGIN